MSKTPAAARARRRRWLAQGMAASTGDKTRGLTRLGCADLMLLETRKGANRKLGGLA